MPHSELVKARRIAKVLELISDGLRETAIVQKLSTTWKISERQMWNYIRYAHNELIAVLQAEQDSFIAEGLQRFDRVYFKALNDKQYSAATTAAKEKLQLLGLYKQQTDLKQDFQFEIKLINEPRKNEDEGNYPQGN